MIALARIVGQQLADLAGLVVLSLRPRRSVAAENLFLRRQLAPYLERGAKPGRVDAATRFSLALLSRLFDWRDALVVVQPETLIRWHRAGWRLFWRIKSRPGRPRIPLELRQLIRRMASENPLWGEERIANELDEHGVLLKGTEDLPKLYGLVAERLKLSPGAHEEKVFKQILGGCHAVVEGLGTLRNRLGDAHGKGSRPLRPTARHAQLAVNLAGAMSTFLIETHREHGS